MTMPTQPCQDLCTAIASVNAVPVNAVGVRDDPVSNPLADGLVTAHHRRSVCRA